MNDVKAIMTFLGLACCIGIADVVIPTKVELALPAKLETEFGNKVRVGTYTLYRKSVQDVKAGDNARGCNLRNTTTEVAPGVFAQTLLYHPFHEGCTPYVPPTEKWIMTNTGVVLTFVLDDGSTFQRENWTNGVPRKWKLESAWKEANP